MKETIESTDGREQGRHPFRVSISAVDNLLLAQIAFSPTPGSSLAFGVFFGGEKTPPQVWGLLSRLDRGKPGLAEALLQALTEFREKEGWFGYKEYFTAHAIKNLRNLPDPKSVGEIRIPVRVDSNLE